MEPTYSGTTPTQTSDRNAPALGRASGERQLAQRGRCCPTAVALSSSQGIDIVAHLRCTRWRAPRDGPETSGSSGSSSTLLTAMRWPSLRECRSVRSGSPVRSHATTAYPAWVLTRPMMRQVAALVNRAGWEYRLLRGPACLVLDRASGRGLRARDELAVTQLTAGLADRGDGWPFSARTSCNARITDPPET